jgi:ribonuclease HI
MLNIYVDGSYKPHKGSGTCGGVGIYFGDNHPCNLSVTIVSDGADSGTLEVVAICIALLVTTNINKITIYSDSQHAVDPLTSRYTEYASNGWRTKKNTALADKKFFQECTTVIEDRRSKGHKVRIKKVIAHSGVKGNQMADMLAGYASDSSNSINSSGCIVSIIVLGNSIFESIKHDSNIMKINNILANEKSVDDLATETEIVEDTGYLSEQEFWSKPLSIRSVICDDQEQNHMFLLCVRGGCMIQVKYPSDHPINSATGIGNLSKSTIIVTICRGCIVSDIEDGSKLSPLSYTNEMKIHIDKIKLSSTIIETSKYGRCAREISNVDQTVFSSNGYVKCVSITDISMKLNSTCIAMSVDVDSFSTLPYLKFGFL